MVKLIDKIICEFQNVKCIYIRCKDCKFIFGKYQDFVNNTSKFWHIKYSQLNWKAKLIIQQKHNNLYCDCKVGFRFYSNDVFLFKRAMEIVH